MWDKGEGAAVVRLPRRFNADTMNYFIGRVVDERRNATCSHVTFDFSELDFIEPVGVVVLSNLIEYLKRIGVAVLFGYAGTRTPATNYLDDSGFFERYVGRKFRESASVRSSTLPLEHIAGADSTAYLYFKLMPWIGWVVKQSEYSLAPLRASLEEIFHNVKDHSGVDIGCAFAQYFPREHRLQFALSDFGDGIPEVVRRVRPGITDSEALKLACQEGFTTQTNVWNRGAGLPTLVKFVTQRNGGRVFLQSGSARLAATPHSDGTKLTARTIPGWYPGTLVQVILDASHLPKLAEDVEQEEFSWS